ncbi:hypothetical protein JVU11DRAFT_3812 [Chiua virens]|nr:hypothetical protein JVU11DRAFT_3812 [Chiua virens]
MGWFSTSKPEVAAASREDRKQCWESRDVYFACLDCVGVLEAGKEGNACSKEKSRYEASCAKSWASPSLFAASSCDVLDTAILYRSRSNILTNVGSWLNSKRICWRSLRCRLRPQDNVDPLLLSVSTAHRWSANTGSSASDVLIYLSPSSPNSRNMTTFNVPEAIIGATNSVVTSWDP